MKTKPAADPAKLRELGRALKRLERHSGGALALHAQLRMALLNCIHAGHWIPGDRLPPETDLVEATGLSLGTVQRALRALTDEGVVRRQQGSGSFVANAPDRVGDVAHCQFLADDGSDLLPVFSRVLGRRAAGRNGPWAGHFAPDARIVRLDRLLDVNDEFDVYSRFYFDGGRFPGLATRPLAELAGTNLRLLLGQEAPVPSGGIRQTIHVVQAPADVARHMGVADGSWIARLNILHRIAGSQEALYYQQMFFPPTERHFVMQQAT